MLNYNKGVTPRMLPRLQYVWVQDLEGWNVSLVNVE